MYNADDLRGIALSYGGILPRARGMDMRSVALRVKASTQTGVNIGNSPRLLDRHTSLFTLSGNESIHATIKTRKDETLFT